MSSTSDFIRDIPDFPEPGIVYKDITPLLADASAFADAVAAMTAPLRAASIDVIVGMEARGFLFGPPIAQALGVGFVPVRKPGKLPSDTRSMSYELEYGTDTLEIHSDALSPGQRVGLVDDVLATGGTLAASAALVRSMDAVPVAASVLLELAFLPGRAKLSDIEVHTVVEVH